MGYHYAIELINVSRNERRSKYLFPCTTIAFFTHFPFPILCCVPVSSTRTFIFSLSSLPAPCLLTVDKSSLISFQQNKYVLLYSLFYSAVVYYSTLFLFISCSVSPLSVAFINVSLKIHRSLWIFPLLVWILFWYHVVLWTSGIPHMFSDVHHHKTTNGFF